MSTIQSATRTRALLTCGAAAGPIFVTTVMVQALTRDGFDLSHQPLSLLALGDLGWIQISNFILTGALALAFALGVRDTVRAGRGSVWGHRLIAVFGIGLIAGGVFVPDPALGYPIGTPDEIPDSFSWHGILHAIAPPLSFLALIAALVAYARRFAAIGERGWTVATLTAAALCLVLSVPGPGGSVRLAAGITIGFAWLLAFALRLLRA